MKEGKRPATLAPVTPQRPAWLPAEAGETWKAIICDLEAAGVPLQRIDGHAIGMFALTILEAEKATAKNDLKLAARLGRDALQWAGAIGATPASRARLNIKPAQEPEGNDPWAALENN